MDIGGVVGSQECDGFRHFLGLTRPPRGAHFDLYIQRMLRHFQYTRDHLSLDGTRQDSVDADACMSVIQGYLTGQPNNACLAEV
jgi:hypothetical protein